MTARSTSTLQCPVPLWFDTAHASITHDITALLVVSDSEGVSSEQLLYTGCTSGKIVQWKKSQQDAAVYAPTAVLLRRAASCITALTSVEHEQSTYVCSSDVEGFMHLWTTSGKCVQSELVLPFAASALVSLSISSHSATASPRAPAAAATAPSTGSLPPRPRSAAGQYTSPVPLQHAQPSPARLKSYVLAYNIQRSVLYIVSIPSLRVVRVIKLAAAVVGVEIVHAATQPHILITLSNNTVHLYQPHRLLYDGPVHLDVSAAANSHAAQHVTQLPTDLLPTRLTCSAVNPMNINELLICTARHFALINVQSGQFVTALHSLPTAVDNEVTAARRRSIIAGAGYTADAQCVVVYTTLGELYAASHSSLQSDTVRWTELSRITSKADLTAVVVNQSTILAAHSDGTIGTYDLTALVIPIDQLQPATVHRTSQHVVEPQLTSSTMYMDWKQRKLSIAQGYADGRCSLTSLPASLQSDAALGWNHHASAVTCIQHVYTDSLQTQLCVVTGSSDTTVKLYSTLDASMQHTFRCMSAVVQLFVPYMSTTSSLASTNNNTAAKQQSINDGYVCAYCADRSVRVLSMFDRRHVTTLRGHDSRVVGVYRNQWCKSNVAVVTHTSRGTVYVWSLIDGRLTTKLTDSVAAYRFLTCQQLIPAGASQIGELAQQYHAHSHDNKPPAVPGQGSSIELPFNLLRMRHPKRSYIPIGAEFQQYVLQQHVSHGTLPAPPPTADAVDDLNRYGLQCHIFSIDINALLRELQYSKGQPDALTTLCLSLIFDCDHHSSIQSVLHDQLHLSLSAHLPPSLQVLYGISTDRGAASLVAASTANSLDRWSYSPAVTAVQLLVTTTIAMYQAATAANQAHQQAWNRVVYYYTTQLPFQLSSPYIEADLQVLSSYSLDLNCHIHTAARVLIQAVIGRMSEVQQNSLLDMYASQLSLRASHAAPTRPQTSGASAAAHTSSMHRSNSGPSVAGVQPIQQQAPGTSPPRHQPAPTARRTLVTDSELEAALIMTLIGVHQVAHRRRKQRLLSGEQQSGAASKPAPTNFESKSSLVAQVLFRAVTVSGIDHEADAVKVALACDLLTRGIGVYRKHITDPSDLLRKLHQLELTRSEELVDSAQRALLEIAHYAPGHFVTAMGRDALNTRAPTPLRQRALMSLVALVRKYPPSLYQHVPSAVQVIIRCLDPTELTTRKILLQPATAALHVLVQTYPQCSFHQASQRFAAGTTAQLGAAIVIYDLRTATKWRVLEGHSGDVNAVSFNVDGTVLVSYAANEGAQATARVWHTASAGLFAGLLGTQGKCAKIIQLPVITTNQPARSPDSGGSSASSGRSISRSISVPTGLKANPQKPAAMLSQHGLLPEDADDANEDAVQATADEPSSETLTKQLLSVAFHWLTPTLVQLRREDGSTVDIQI